MTISTDPTKSFYIYRTDGTLIFQRDSVTLAYCYGCANGGSDVKGIVNTNSGTKMLLFNSDNQYFVYGLCGTLPSQIDIDEIQSQSYIKLYPNPGSKEIKFEIESSNGFIDGKLFIYNSLNKLITTIPVTKNESSYVLNVDSFSEGIYFYSFRSSNKLMQSGKFIVTQ